MGISKAPYALKDKFANLPNTEMDKIVRAAFYLVPEVEWRWPKPGERIYDRPADYVEVWLEHLRPGWNPSYHQFVNYFFKCVYKISIM